MLGIIDNVSWIIIIQLARDVSAMAKEMDGSAVKKNNISVYIIPKREFRIVAIASAFQAEMIMGSSPIIRS